MNIEKEITTSGKLIIKKCHLCGKITEETKEISKCPNCNKSFLPLNYFSKIHAKNSEDFKRLFSNCDELEEKDLIKGLYAIW